MIYDHEKMAGMRALRLWQEGVVLTCPACGAVLSPIPEATPIGIMPFGLTCPVNMKHVYVYGETRKALDSIRGVINMMSGVRD